MAGVLTERDCGCVRGLLEQAWRSVAESGTPALLVTGSAAAPSVAWASQSLATLLNTTVAELVERPLAELTELADVDQSGWVDTVAELIRAGHGTNEAWARSLTGREIRLRIDVSAVSDEQRTASGWLVILAPQVEDGDAERAAALRAAEARFAALAESAPIGIFLSESGMRLGYVNDQFVELCGLPQFQLLGTEWLNAIAPQDVAALCAAVEEVLRGEPRDLNVRLNSAEEIPQWVHLRLAPITTATRGAGFIGTAEDVTQRRAWEDKITYQAQHDPLTGLVNRRRLIELLQDLLIGRRSRDRHFAVMFIDLDGFKSINDTHGHEVGDRVLVEVARRMRRVAREFDLVSRVAGDEFVVVLRNVVDPAEAEAAARRQLHALATPIRIGDHDQLVSASIGVAIPGPDETVESLLRAADKVMYAAKSAGGSAYRLVTGGDPQ